MDNSAIKISYTYPTKNWIEWIKPPIDGIKRLWSQDPWCEICWGSFSLICPKCLVHLYIVSRYMKIDKTYWTYCFNRCRHCFPMFHKRRGERYSTILITELDFHRVKSGPGASILLFQPFSYVLPKPWREVWKSGQIFLDI